MSNAMKYLVGFTATIVLAMIVGHMTTYIMYPGTIRLLTSFILGAIIGIVGFNLTEKWVEDKDSL
jgi:hypothetical protein